MGEVLAKAVIILMVSTEAAVAVVMAVVSCLFHLSDSLIRW